MNIKYTPLRKQERKRSASESKAHAMRNIPQPGNPTRGSATGRPIMALLDLLGRRWALRIIWELREQPLSFRDLQARCDAISSSVLNDRLTELKAAGIVQSAANGYTLTKEGRRLLDIYPPVQAWAERWAKRQRAAAEARASHSP